MIFKERKNGYVVISKFDFNGKDGKKVFMLKLADPRGNLKNIAIDSKLYDEFVIGDNILISESYELLEG